MFTLLINTDLVSAHKNKNNALLNLDTMLLFSGQPTNKVDLDKNGLLVCKLENCKLELNQFDGMLKGVNMPWRGTVLNSGAPTHFAYICEKNPVVILKGEIGIGKNMLLHKSHLVKGEQFELDLFLINVNA